MSGIRSFGTRASDRAFLPGNIFGANSYLVVPAEYGTEDCPVEVDFEAALLDFFQQNVVVDTSDEERRIDAYLSVFNSQSDIDNLSLLHDLFTHLKKTTGRSLSEVARYFMQIGLGESVLTCLPFLILQPFSPFPDTQVYHAAALLGICKVATLEFPGDRPKLLYGFPDDRPKLLRLATKTIEKVIFERDLKSFITDVLARPYAPFRDEDDKEPKKRATKQTPLTRLRSHGSPFFYGKFMFKIGEFVKNPDQVPGIEYLAAEALTALIE
jgi:hypothetical protein